MRRAHLVVCILSLALGACAGTQEKKSLPIEEWRQPTEQHKKVVAGAGEWEGTLTMFMPGMPTQGIPAKETVEAIGPFWVQTRFTCDFGGMPYLGTGCVGYDPATGKYVGTWIDNTMSYFAWMEGEKDSSGKLNLRWMAPDETTGELVAHRIVSEDTANGRLQTFYKGEGDGTKTMTIEMKRKGS